METLILESGHREVQKRTFRDAIFRYMDEVSARKRTAESEFYLLKHTAETFIGDVLLSELDETHLARYRDLRLEEVKPSSVRREMAIISHLCSIALKEWRWLSRNPMTNVRKPSSGQGRFRRITDDEIERLKFAAFYEDFPHSVQSRVMHAFLFAIETAMRAGEIMGLKWQDINLDKRVAHLPMTKNGTARTVPLTAQAIDLLKQLPSTEGSVFNLKQMTGTFIQIRRKANIDDLHFHDSRHEAITRLSKRLDVLALARMVGHRNIQQLMVYYNKSAEDIAKELS